MNLGFYRVSSVANGEHAKAVNGYTNVAYVGGVDGGYSEATEEERMVGLKRHLKLITREGLRVIFDLEVGAGRLSIGQGLKCAKPYWDYVTHVVLADEQATLNYADIYEKAARKIEQLGLAPRPLGAVLMPEQLLEIDRDRLVPLDFIGIEAYHTLGHPNPRKQILKRTTQIKQRFPGKSFLMVAQAYDRNGAYRDINAICRINSDTYELLCKGDPNVIAMVGFAYGREGGTRDYPALQAVYKGIWGSINA